MARVAVFGMGYVGCVTASCLSQDGHHVIGVDVDSAKVAEINSGTSPVAETGLDALIAAQVMSGNLRATTDVALAVRESDIALIAVGTPSSKDGSVDYSIVERVIQTIGNEFRSNPKRYTVVVRSTLLPGILEDRLALLLAESSGQALGEQLRLCNNPEFLRESSAIRDYYHPPFILVGAADEVTARIVFDLYQAVEAERRQTDTRTAALVKYASNCFHAVKIAFANEIGSLARELGADGRAVMDLVISDRKLNVSPAYLKPGFAFGGSCLPKDLRALTRYAEMQALRLNLLGSVLPSNEQHLKRGLHIIRELGCKRIGLVGFSFKAGTDDLRESPMVDLAETLLGWGHDVKVYDPNVSYSRLRGRNLAYVDQHLPHLAALLVPKPTILVAHAELLVLCTDVADEFDWKGNFKGRILDLRHDLAHGGIAPRRPT